MFICDKHMERHAGSYEYNIGELASLNNFPKQASLGPHLSVLHTPSSSTRSMNFDPSDPTGPGCLLVGWAPPTASGAGMLGFRAHQLASECLVSELANLPPGASVFSSVQWG